MKRTIQHYNDKANHYFSLYNSVDAENVHEDWKSILNSTIPGTALDVGAGSGRDANWLAEKGWRVVATEPAGALRELAQQNAHAEILWSNASLPDLATLPLSNQKFDLILLSAVWMHLPEKVRPQALARLSELLSKSGRIFISLRFGPSDEDRPMYPVSYEELQTLAGNNCLEARNLTPTPTQDSLRRKEVNWATIELMREVNK